MNLQITEKAASKSAFHAIFGDANLGVAGERTAVWSTKFLRNFL